MHIEKGREQTMSGNTEGETSGRDDREQAAAAMSTWRLTTIIGALFLGTFLFGLDINIIGVAIPYITTQFKSLPDVSWYGAAYLLTVTVFQPLFGNFYKFFDAKSIYLGSLIIFEGEIILMTGTATRELRRHILRRSNWRNCHMEKSQ